MTVWKLVEWLGLTEAGIRVSEENDLEEQRLATTGQEIVRMTACFEEILKEDRSFLPDYSD
jgi:hypothetical protein